MSPSMQDVMFAARSKLLSDTTFAELIGSDVGRDDIGGAYRDGWVFKASDDLLKPDRDPRNSGKSSVVLAMRDPWAGPNIHNSLRFRQLYFKVWSDMTRASDNTLTAAKDAEFRCDRVSQAIIDVFNDVANTDHNWPNGVFIISSVLWNDLKINDVPTDDGLITGTFSFALELG